MGKKCIPGMFCVENMTLFLVVVIGIMVLYLYYVYFMKNTVAEKREYNPTIILANSTYPPSALLNDPYIPPLKQDAIMKPTGDVRGMIPIPGVPVNVKTNSANLPYNQVGILTTKSNGTMILPLMGRNLWNGRDKWQYYTMSNTAGALNTKLPISVNGRSCTGEYGCDSISNGDTVYVEGYNDTFRATIYENSMLQYLPF